MECCRPTLMDLYVPLPEEVIPDDQHVQYHHFGYDGRFNVDGQPLDPWGFPYRYAVTNATVELYTTGADKSARGCWNLCRPEQRRPA